MTDVFVAFDRGASLEPDAASTGTSAATATTIAAAIVTSDAMASALSVIFTGFTTAALVGLTTAQAQGLITGIVAGIRSVQLAGTALSAVIDTVNSSGKDVELRIDRDSGITRGEAGVIAEAIERVLNDGRVTIMPL